MNPLQRAVRDLVAEVLTDLDADLSVEDLERSLGRPPQSAMGDVALGCFPLARTLRKSPAAIARDLQTVLVRRLGAAPLLAGVEAAGPYLNFRADRPAYASVIIPAAVAGELIRGDTGTGRTIVIDFSSPNVAKPFGIGHLRSTAIGAAIGRLFRARGYEVVGINHLGDWGTQFGKLIAAWEHWGDEQALQRDPIGHLYELYVRFHDLEETDLELARQGRDWFRRLEEGDERARALWQRFREASLREFARIYERMGVSFEHTWGEAFYEAHLDPTVERLDQAGLLEESEGALIVRVDDIYPNTSPCLIRRSDGASLYTTRDIAAALHRYETFEPERMLYVTGADQADHFRKVFGVLRRLGLPWAERCEHVPFGRIHGISTRKGTLVFLEDVFDRARDLSLEIMRDRDMSDEESRREAEKIGIGAVVFFDLSKERIKDADFDWDAILQITGRTGPGLQYTQVRLKSLLSKFEAVHGALPEPAAVSYDALGEVEEMALLQAMGDFGEVIDKAAEAYEPAILSRYLLDLADTFNAFYSSGRRIVSDDAELSTARTSLCRALLSVLLTGLQILGVPAPDRM